MANVLAGLLILATISGVGTPFQRQWIYASETSAVIYWQLADIREQALSYIEYGETEALGRRTELTKKPRWSQFHRLKALRTDATYHYRMVVVDPATQQETRSEILTFATQSKADALRIPEQVQGPPFVLDKADTTYILTQDLTAEGTAFIITGANVTLDLDGHTVSFGNNTDEQVRGVWAKNKGGAVICNGHIVQGARSKEYSAAVESRWRTFPTEIFGISTHVHLKCAYPVKFLGAAADAHIHHNHLYSQVTEIESRHYPGNDLLRLDIKGGNIHVHDNILTEGCHVGIRLSGQGSDVEVDHNDIQHHQQYVNGYAIAASCAGSGIHHNRVTSCGRGVHLTGEAIRFHDNYMDIYGHQQLSDMPQGSRPFRHQQVELHGIKFEGRKARNCDVYGNFVKIVQRLPHDSDGKGTPEDKITSGVYVRSEATGIASDKLIDDSQNWEVDRWKGYFVKYAPHLPPAQITGNDATTLIAEFQNASPQEYTIYMKWEYVPATPLNIACYDPNAMNEVHDNVFVALTEYTETRHGGYGDSGQWASAIHFVGMDKGEAQQRMYSILIHDNRFISNDLFASSGGPVNMTVRIEENVFTLSDELPPTEKREDFRRLGALLEAQIRTASKLITD
jgi:hypothetical protein